MKKRFSLIHIPKGLVKIALASALVAVGCNGWAAISLGAASPYALFQLGGGGNFNTSDATVQGDVAFGPGNYGVTLGNLGINGNVFDSGNRAITPANLHSFTDVPLGQNPIIGPFTGTVTHNVDLAQAVLDAQNASAAAAGLPVDFNLGNLTSGQTINLNSVSPMTPGVYVINTTTLALQSGVVLTLNGAGIAPGSQVIINVSGSFTLNGGQIVGAGGLDASHILVNDTGTQGASITGSGILQGSFLGPRVNAQFNNNAAAVFGQVIVQSVQFSSHFRVFGELFIPEPSSIMAASLLLIPLGASALRIVRKR
jgi:hypothetical protein